MAPSNYSGPTNLHSGNARLVGGDNRLPVSTTLRFATGTGLQMNDVNQTLGGLVLTSKLPRYQAVQR